MKAESRRPADRTRLAIVSLQISAMLFVFAAVLLAMAPFFTSRLDVSEHVLRTGMIWLIAALVIALAAWTFVVAQGLVNRKRWAWISAIVLFVLYVPSVFLPLGVLGLFGALSKGTRVRFDVHRSHSTVHR